MRFRGITFQRLYCHHIEVFFKTANSQLKLEKEFQSQPYDALTSHTTIVFSRYIILAWQSRCHSDQRTLGGLFYEFIEDAFKQTTNRIEKLIQSQLEQWIFGLPSYIKTYLTISLCES